MILARLLLALCALGVLVLPAAARKPGSEATASKSETVVQKESPDDAARLEGEKRFRANCGRCHQYPHKFPPRMILTIERHMRVRALVTDEDMRLIVSFLTQ